MNWIAFVQANPHLWESVLEFWNVIHASQSMVGASTLDKAQHDEMTAAITAAQVKIARPVP